MEDQENLNVWKLYLLRKTSSRRKMSDKEMSCWEETISGFTYKWYIDMFMKKVACCFEAILTRINENDSTWLQFLSTYRSKHQNTLFHFRQPKSCYTKHFSLETRTIDAWKACKHILMIEKYKAINHLNPSYIWEFFIKKDKPYRRRIKVLCRFHQDKNVCVD